MSRKLLSAIFILMALGLVLFPNTITLADEHNSTISLSGTGSSTIVPDIAVVSFGVVEEAKTAREALDANSASMAAILKAMKEAGIEDKDLQTSGFNIQPRYFYPKRKANGEQPAPEITGYRVSNSLTIRVRKIETVGGILDLSVTLGMNSGGNIQFTNSDTQAVLKEARISAVKDAMAKAETLAQAAGVELGDILEISENVNRPRPVAIAQARSLSVQEDAAVPIATGENTYRVTVQMRWAISQ